MLTFYYGSGSPYSWRVWLALECKRIPYELKVMSFSAGDLKTPEYAAINPRRKVPAIVDDGFALAESAAIVKYLDERHPNEPLLFPGDVRRRAQVRRLVREADEYFATALETLVDNILFAPQQERSEPAIARARAGLRKEFSGWEKRIASDYLAGPLSAADFTLYPAVALLLRMENKNPELDIRSMIGPKIAAWMKRIEALPYFDKTIPPHWKAA